MAVDRHQRGPRRPAHSAGMDIARAGCTFALAAVLAACAAAPASNAGGEEELFLSATLRTPALDPLTGYPVPGTFDVDAVDGVSCTLRNDKGTWALVTPGKVQVERSLQPLEIECAKEGFRTLRWKMECLTPQQREKKAGGDVGLALAVISIPAGIVTLPVGGASLIVQGALNLGEHAYTASRPEECVYAFGAFAVTMSKAAE